MGERIQHEAAASMAPELWSSAFVLMGLRFDQALIATLRRGVLNMKESVVYQEILQEGMQRGMQRGIEQGIEQGIQKGVQEGRLAEARDLLLRVGRKWLGEPDESARATIARFSRPEEIEVLMERLRDVQNWNELLSGCT
jgi:predicted transposase YdaD